MDITKYVLMVVLDPSLQFVVGITKKKGPAYLIGKLTFPGGKLEDGELPLTAAAREMQEETGLVIPAQDWVKIQHLSTETKQMTTFAAVCDRFFCAHTREEEPVWHLAVPRHQEYATRQPAQYAPDFLNRLELALHAFKPPLLKAA